MVIDRSIGHLEHSHINIMGLDILGQTHSLSRKSTCKSALSTHTEREIDKIYSNGLRSMSQKSMQVGDEKLICNTYSGLSVTSMASTQQRQYAVCIHRSIAYRIMSNAVTTLPHGYNEPGTKKRELSHARQSESWRNRSNNSM